MNDTSRTALVLVCASLLGLACSPQDSRNGRQIDQTIESLLDHYRDRAEQADRDQDVLQSKAALIKLEAGLEWANSFAREIEPEVLLEEKVGVYLRLADAERVLGNETRSSHYVEKASELCDGWELGPVCDDERLAES